MRVKIVGGLFLSLLLAATVLPAAAQEPARGRGEPAVSGAEMLKAMRAICGHRETPPAAAAPVGPAETARATEAVLA